MRRGRTGGVRTHFPKSCPKPSAAAGMSRALRAHQPRTARSQALSDTSQLLEIAGFFAFFGVFLTSSSPFPGVFSAPWDEQRGLLGLSRSRPTGHPRDPFTRRAPLSRHRECPAPSLSSCFAFPFPWLGSGHPTPWSAGTPPACSAEPSPSAVPRFKANPDGKGVAGGPGEGGKAPSVANRRRRKSISLIPPRWKPLLFYPPPFLLRTY